MILTDDYITSIKKYVKNCNKDIPKRIINTTERAIGDGYLGIVENELIDSNEFEVYMFINLKNNIASPLLYEKYNNKEAAKKYFSDLLSLINDMDLNKIKEKIEK